MATRRAVVVTALLVAAVGGAWGVLARSDEPRSPARDALVAQPVAAVPARSAAAGGAAESLRTVPIAPTVDGAQVQVRVVGSNGNPAAGAVVHYADPSRGDETLRFDVERRLAAAGTRLVADAAGIVRWPAIAVERQFWQVVARAGGEFGESWIAKDAPPSEVHVLQLRADVAAMVKVLDAQHRPVAGIPVRVTFVGRGERPYDGHDDLGVSDAAGEVPLAHVQLWSERIEPRGSTLPAMLGLRLPGVPAAVEIDAARPPAEPIVLFVPPTGAIDVVVRDSYGQPRVDTRIGLRRDHAADAVHHERVFETKLDEHGHGSFPIVALGETWHIGFTMSDPNGWRQVAGPRVANERVVVRFEPAPGPFVTGRLMRDGAPASAWGVTISIDAKPASYQPRLTDDAGRFRVAVAAAWLDRRVEAIQFDAGEERGSWRGTVQLTAGDHELGDIVLAPIPTLVAGTLVGPGGGPLPANTRAGIQRKAPGDTTWQWLGVHLGQKPDGTFHARAEPPTGELRLVVFGDGFAPVVPLPFVAGARDLRIELHAGGSLRAMARIGTQIAGHCMEPLLVPDGAGAAEFVVLPFNPHLDSRVPGERSFVKDEPLTQQWTWPAVAPGRYRLEVWLRGQRAPSLVVPDLVVVDGERNEDPRCQDLTIAGLQTIVIKVPQVDTVPRASPTAGGGFVFVLDGDVTTSRCVQLDGPLAFFTAARPLDVLVRVPGHRDRILRGLTADTTVELERGIAVNLRCEPPPAAGEQVQCSLTAIDDRFGTANAVIYSPACGGSLPEPWYRIAVTTAPWPAEGATFHVPAPGRYRVTATARTADGSDRSCLCTPAEIDVPEAGIALTVARR